MKLTRRALARLASDAAPATVRLALAQDARRVGACPANPPGRFEDETGPPGFGVDLGTKAARRTGRTAWNAGHGVRAPFGATAANRADISVLSLSLADDAPERRTCAPLQVAGRRCARSRMQGTAGPAGIGDHRPAIGTDGMVAAFHAGWFGDGRAPGSVTRTPRYLLTHGNT